MSGDPLRIRPTRAPRLVDEVLTKLRDSVIDGVLPAGTQLSQVDLADRLGVSRTPLREALRVLESEVLVRVSDDGRAVEVVTLGPDDLRDMYQLREVIDGLAARLAARHGISPAEQDRAQALLHEIAASSRPYDPVRRNRAHATFHEFIAKASRNTKVRSYTSLIRTSSAALYLPLVRDRAAASLLATTTAANYQEILDRAQQQHEDILAAIVARDPQRAEEAARRHIQRTLSMASHFAVGPSGRGDDPGSIS